MECAERDRLEEILRMATQQLNAAKANELVQGPCKSPSAKRNVAAIVRHQKAAIETYRKHTANHGCNR